MNDDIVVFVDESGTTVLKDQSKDQRFYVSTAIIVQWSQVAELNEMIDSISTSFNNGQPLKSSSIGGNIDRRIRLLNELGRVPFHYMAFVFDKSKIDTTSGLRYKKVFYKNVNGRLYDFISKNTVGKVHAYVDSYGSEEYQKSAFEYFYRRSGLFSNIEFHREDDDEKRLVQIADIISGSIRCWFADGLIKDEKHLQLRAALKQKEISLVCWPIQYSEPDTMPLEEVEDPSDKDIQRIMISMAVKLIERYEMSDKLDEQMRAEVLKCLIEAKIEGRNVFCDYLIDVVNRGREKPIGRKAFLSEVIGGIRREGIVVTGTSKGYRIATTMSDIQAYLQQDRTVILPMLSKLECARRLLLANSQIDILSGNGNDELRACVDAVADVHLVEYDGQTEIDDEKVLPNE